MAGGRPSDDRQRRRRRGSTERGSAQRGSSERRSGWARPREGAASRRPGGQGPGRPPRRSPPRSLTGGAFKLSSTRRAAVLAMLVCAMALSVAVPLRTYWGQRQELADQQRQRADLSQQVGALEQRRSELSDPAHVQGEVRQRLGYVRPGETPYIVETSPAQPAQPPPGALDPGVPGVPGPGELPWYERVWDSLTGG